MDDVRNAASGLVRSGGSVAVKASVKELYDFRFE